jgi:glycosyltransferase involved in cell wall biosynthesis
VKPAIVEIVQELAPPGGIQVMVLELGRWLAGEFDVHIVSLEGSVERLCAIWSRAAAIRDQLYALNKSPGRSPQTVWRLTRLLRKIRPCAVHTHHIGPLLYGGLAARLAGVRRLVHTEHDVWHLLSPRRRRLEAAALAMLRPRLVADANVVGLGLSRAFPSSRPRIIPNGIDTSSFTPGDRAAARDVLGLPPSARLIGTSGRLEVVKGHDLLITALARLPSDITLALAGEGSQRSSLERQAADLGLRDRIYFLSHVDDIASFYRALDVFCLPSRNEGLPLSLLEAQACGVPAIATDVGAVRDVLAPAASLAVAADSTAELADGLRLMFERNLQVDPRPFVVQHYDLQNMGRAYRDVLTA